MNLAYNLGNSIQADRLIKDVTKLCGKVSPNQASDTLLVISLKNITDYEGESPLPKLEYKPDNLEKNI